MVIRQRAVMFLAGLVNLVWAKRGMDAHLRPNVPGDQCDLTELFNRKQFYAELVFCECERYSTGLLNSRCKDAAKVQPEVRWYIAHGVSTLRPQDIWLADAGDYWMEEEECVFTKPYDPEYAKQEAIAKGESPDNIASGDPQKYWNLIYTMEDPAYKFWRIGYQCRKCPIYLPVSKYHERGVEMPPGESCNWKNSCGCDDQAADPNSPSGVLCTQAQ
jgi:hypothetical protein